MSGRHSRLHLYLLGKDLHILQRLSRDFSQTPVHASSKRHSTLVISPFCFQLNTFADPLSYQRDRARSVNPEQHEAALHALEIYKSWLLDVYLQTGRSNPILVLPLGEVGPNHRDEWPGCICIAIRKIHAYDTLVTVRRVTSNCGNHFS